MRETLKQDVKAVWRRYFVRGPFSLKELADETLSEARLRKLGDPDDVKAPDLGDVRHLLPRLLKADPVAALSFVDEVLGLRAAGVVLHLAQKAGAATSLVREAAEAGAAVGTVQALALRVEADGRVTAGEAAELSTATDLAERELADLREAAKRAAAEVER